VNFEAGLGLPFTVKRQAREEQQKERRFHAETMTDWRTLFVSTS
jgi:hypothetical protein